MHYQSSGAGRQPGLLPRDKQPSADSHSYFILQYKAFHSINSDENGVPPPVIKFFFSVLFLFVITRTRGGVFFMGFVFVRHRIPILIRAPNARIPKVQYYGVEHRQGGHGTEPEIEPAVAKVIKRRPPDGEVFNGDFFKIRDKYKRCSVTKDLYHNASTEHKNKLSRRNP